MNAMNPRPTSIRIFLADGTPEGLLIVEKSNWTGKALVSSRSDLPRALNRDELDQPGVYVLTGPGDEGSERAYVGEADVLRNRIRRHAESKDFWTRFVAFTSTNEGLNKAHVRYVEARLIERARGAKLWDLENGTQPASPPLSEADRADAEWFLHEMLVIFPLLGISAFETAGAKPVLEDRETSPELFLSQRGADARGREAADGFVVRSGSLARATEIPSIHQYLRDWRRRLKTRGVLIPSGDHLRFTQDFRFPSPSTAAGVLVGGSANGRRRWKDADGQTLAELQQQRADSAGR